jgi:hypothetical protein
MSVRDWVEARADYVRFPPGKMYERRPPRPEKAPEGLSDEERRQVAATSWAMVAQYPGTCPRCSEPIFPGESRVRKELGAGGGWIHIECIVGAPSPAP